MFTRRTSTDTGLRPEPTSMATSHMEKIPKLVGNNKGSGGTVPIGKADFARYVGSI